MRVWTLAVALVAGCGDGSGGGGGFEGWPTCEPHPNGAPCCPQGLSLDEGDCPEGHHLEVVDGAAREGSWCRPTSGTPSPNAPAFLVDRESGMTARYGTFGRIAECYPEAAYQKYVSVSDGAGGGCVTDCYDEDGRPADCRAVTGQPGATVCP